MHPILIRRVWSERMLTIPVGVRILPQNFIVDRFEFGWLLNKMIILGLTKLEHADLPLKGPTEVPKLTKTHPKASAAPIGW